MLETPQARTEKRHDTAKEWKQRKGVGVVGPLSAYVPGELRMQAT
jgi:hypothetical protein